MSPLRGALFPEGAERNDSIMTSSTDARVTAVPGTRRACVYAAALVVAAALGACARAPEVAVPVLCSEVLPAGGTAATGDAPSLGVDDVLDLVVALDSVPPGPGRVLVRVDGLAEAGLVRFLLPPAAAAAVGMTLQPPPSFHGCGALGPVGFELRAPSAPRAKAWVRVSSDRPVRVRPRVAGRASEPVLVAPGASAVVEWGG